MDYFSVVVVFVFAVIVAVFSIMYFCVLKIKKINNNKIQSAYQWYYSKIEKKMTKFLKQIDMFFAKLESNK